MNKMKTAIVAFVSSVLWTAIPATADECRETAKLYGAMMRASLICNFPERPALMKAMSVLHEVCPAPSEEAFKEALRPGVEEGFRIFDRERQRNGKRKACADWDKFIRAISEFPSRKGR